MNSEQVKKLSENQKKCIKKTFKNSLIENIFSIKNSMDKTHKVLCFLGIKISFRKKIIISKKEAIEYINFVQNHYLDSSDYVKITDSNYNFNNNVPKAIAFYLPQFHDFEENVKWFGKGFSEWTNTSKTVPQYKGHYQPHIPIDVGYYNLDDIKVMKRQIELAKKYGIYGFSFYYYWFSGKKVMEKPIESFLADKSLDIPFFIFWANEDWTMLWDNGKDQEVLHKQELLDGDEERFMQDMLPFMRDSRYIKIGNKPLLIIYNPYNYEFERYIKFNQKIRKIAKENGFDDLYIMTTTCRPDNLQYKDYEKFRKDYLIDGLVEFFPQGILTRKIKRLHHKIMNQKFVGHCYDVKTFIDDKEYIYSQDKNLYKGCFPNWDNTPRKCYNGVQIYENTPEYYKKWLKDILKWTQTYHSSENQYVFINAWNEWAEGAYLEPDKKYGYAYLQATKEALEEVSDKID